MNPEQQKQLLEQMRGIHLPEAISWWPLALGWWIVMALCLSIIILGLYKWRKHVRQNIYRKLAENELQAHYEQWQNNKSNSSYIESANEVLRRSVQHISGESLLSSHSGRQWADTLDRFNTTPLSENTRFALSEACYQAEPQVDIDELHLQLSTWLKTHTRSQNA